MGKRRDRRMAAHGNAGRRLKLDLFAEPSGDLGGSSAQDEVEELPNSPSSSGEKPENPLLLLGQYSDDDDGGGGGDADKERSRSPANTNEDNSKVENGNQVKALLKDGSQDLDHSIRGDQLLHEFEKEVGRDYDALEDAQRLDGNISKDSGESASVDVGQDAQQVNGVDTQIVGDTSFGWKMVLHEETNEYYYWNVETGETSWLVPEVLTQQAHVTGDPVYATTTEGTGDMASQNVDFTSGTASIVEGGIQKTNPNGFANGEIGGSVKHHEEATMTAEANLGGEVNHYDSRHGSSGSSDILCDQASIAASAEDDVKDLTETRKSELGTDHWSHLINQAEQLLERLMKLESSKGQDGQDLVSKYTLEVKIRLSDMKSLAPHGSSVHPFWIHSERQLKGLESAIDAKIGLLDKFASDKEVESKNIYDTLIEECNSLETTVPDLKADDKKSECVPAPTAAHALQSQSLGVSKDTFLVNSPYRQSTGGETFSGAVVPDGSTHYSSEDIDMDVDMEVDDISPSSNGMVEQQSKERSAELPTVAIHDEFAVLPPPDDEWAPPPPPPDSEPMPPPPPDEPELPRPIAPPTQVGQPLPYSDQYSLSYSSANYQFYGHPETTATTNIYGQAEGYQVVLPPGSVPYGTVFSAYGDSASAAAASNVAPIAYYQQEAAYPVGVSAVESPLFPVQSDSFSYSTFALDQTGSGHALAEAGGTKKMQYITTDPPEMRSGAADGFSGVPSTSGPSNSAIVEASATTSVKDSGSTSVANPATAVAAAAAAAAVAAAATGDVKVQSKVTRSKKRTVAVAPSLKSNKKVSSLVNKWKAAKEELEEDEEEEAKGALGMLERKRQREIEEWRAQQIASGEAKENANFQPLVGDWRERVKRKRAKAKAMEVSAKETGDKVNQKPNLAQLSGDLPSGWQALWDESSKQVYYGNMTTSETTWVKPAN